MRRRLPADGLVLIGVLIGVPLVPAPARAGLHATAFVVTAWPEHRETAALAQALARAAIDDDNPLTRRDVADVLDPEGDPATVAARRRASEALRLGYMAFANEAYDQALTQFTAAVGYGLGATAAGDLALVVQAMHYAGAAAVRLGRYRAGVRWFHRSLVIAPGAQLKARGVRDTTVDLYERVRARATGSPPSELRVSSWPEGATVYLDGRFVGVTPAVVPVPLAGTHLIRLEKDGFFRWGGPVEVLPGPPEELEVPLHPTRRRSRFARLLNRAVPLTVGDTAPALAAAESLTQLLILDTVVLARIEPRGPDHVALVACEFDLADRQVIRRAGRAFRTRGAELPQALDAWLRAFLQGTTRPDPTLEGLPLAPAPPAPIIAIQGGERPPLTGRWWFWTSVAVLGTGGATAAVLAATAEEPAKPPPTGEILLQF